LVTTAIGPAGTALVREWVSSHASQPVRRGDAPRPIPRPSAASRPRARHARDEARAPVGAGEPRRRDSERCRRRSTRHRTPRWIWPASSPRAAVEPRGNEQVAPRSPMVLHRDPGQCGCCRDRDRSCRGGAVVGARSPRPRRRPRRTRCRSPGRTWRRSPPGSGPRPRWSSRPTRFRSRRSGSCCRKGRERRREALARAAGASRC
jgi:hypothetical protein